MAGQSDFTAQEWRTLRLAPLWIFTALVGTYRDFPELEYEAFWHSVYDTAAGSSGLPRDVLSSMTAERRRIAVEYLSDGRPVASGLRDVVGVLARLPVVEATEVKAAFVQVGKSVATARGPFGRVMSKDDAASLGLVAVLLDVDLEGEPELLAAAKIE